METLSPSVILAAYAEPLLDGRRVAFFGDALSACADELLDRGARLVHLYDPDPARAAEAAARNRSKQISVLPLDTADIAIRDGAFDVAIIADLASMANRAVLLKRVRRALSPRGVAIIASPNPDAKVALLPRPSGARSAPISYYDLFDAVSAEFPEVRMLGQTPFVGYAVVDFAPEREPEVSLDSGLVPGGAEEPEWFVVVASASPVEIEAFSIVQLPAAGVMRGGSALSAADVESERTRAVELERVRAVELERVRALEAELVKRDAWITEIEARATAADARADDAQGEIDALLEKHAKHEKQAKLERQDKQSPPPVQDAGRAELEKKLAEAGVDKVRLEKRIAEQLADKERLEKRAAEQLATEESLEKRASDQERLEKRVTELTGEKERLEKRASEHLAEKERLERRLAEHLGEKERLEKSLAQREEEVQRLVSASAGDGPDDIAALEASLKDRGDRIRKLEADLREAERVGKELVRELARGRGIPEAPRREPAEPPLSPLLSTENARLRADLEAAGWTIQELEGRLSSAPAPAR